MEYFEIIENITLLIHSKKLHSITARNILKVSGSTTTNAIFVNILKKVERGQLVVSLDIVSRLGGDMASRPDLQVTL